MLALRRTKAVRWSDGLGRMGLDIRPALQRTKVLSVALEIQKPPEGGMPEHDVMGPVARPLTVKLILAGDGRQVRPSLIHPADALLSRDTEAAHHFFDDIAQIGQGFVVRSEAEV